MGGGSGGGNTTTTQKADPWSGVQPYLTQGYQQLSNLYQPGAGPQYYPGSTVAGPSGMEQFGNNMQISQAGNMQGVANGASQGLANMNAYANQAAQMGGILVPQAAGGMNAIADNAFQGVGGALSAMNQLNQAGDFNNNPAYQAALQSSIRPLTQQFQEQVMPSIKAGANEAGQMGSSRQGVAEGLASRGYMDAVGDVSANMGNAAYAQGLQALQASGQLGSGLANLAGQMRQGVGALGQAQSSAGMTAQGQATALANGVQAGLGGAGQMVSGLGQQQTAYDQAALSADQSRWNYNQNLPYTMISDYLSMLNGAGGGQTVSSQSGGGGSKAMGALGGAGTGAAIGTAIMPGMGTAIGAGAGALYGLFM